MKASYKIAGLTVEMDTFGRTLKQSEPYRIAPVENPEIIVQSAIEIMRKYYPYMNDDNLEYMGSGEFFYRELLSYGGFQLHSSAVVVDGKAYLFSANSGTGKSTHTSLWLKYFGERAYILNDDKPAVRLIDGVWYAFGTPWSGKHDISVNTGAPIAGICILERGQENEISPYSGKKAIFDIFVQTNRPRGAKSRTLLLDLLDKMISNVPIWKLKCNMELDAVRMSYRAMSGNMEV